MSTTNSLTQLIERGVLEKGVSSDDVSRIAAALPTLEDNVLRRAILVIGYSHDSKYRQLIEGYLEYDRDSLIALEALKVLTKRFGLAVEYLSYIERGIRGFDWDIGSFIQQECLISAAYALLQQPHHKDLAYSIYSRLLENTEEPDVYAVDAAQIALGATPCERALTPFEGSPDLARKFHDRFLSKKMMN